jgi:hypothetical protein
MYHSREVRNKTKKESISNLGYTIKEFNEYVENKLKNMAAALRNDNVGEWDRLYEELIHDKRYHIWWYIHHLNKEV